MMLPWLSTGVVGENRNEDAAANIHSVGAAHAVRDHRSLPAVLHANHPALQGRGGVGRLCGRRCAGRFGSQCGGRGGLVLLRIQLDQYAWDFFCLPGPKTAVLGR